jgi:hypothetical protein
MGRHSAPDDDEDGDVRVASTVAVDAPRTDRHARPDGGGAGEAAAADVPLADQETERLVPPGDEPAPQTGAEPAGLPSTDAGEQRAAPKVGKGNQSTAADLELLRAHSDVRARVIAAIVAPFVIYALVLYLGGSALRVYFIWVWVPLVTAGVLAGSILDSAHRKRGRDAEPG